MNWNGSNFRNVVFLFLRIQDNGESPETKWFWVLYAIFRTLLTPLFRNLLGRCGREHANEQTQHGLPDSHTKVKCLTLHRDAVYNQMGNEILTCIKLNRFIYLIMFSLKENVVNEMHRLNLLVAMFILKNTRRSQYSTFVLILGCQTGLVMLACHSVVYLGFPVGLLFEFSSWNVIKPQFLCRRLILESLGLLINYQTFSMETCRNAFSA
jgi:hypothetical protein